MRRLLALVLCVLACACASEGTEPASTAARGPLPSVSQDGSQGAQDNWDSTPDGCPVFDNGVETGRLPEGLAEVSGLAASSVTPDLLWANNDSGDTATVYALDLGGVAVGKIELPGVEPWDAEDIAVGPRKPGGEPHIHLGDIGDNTRSRDEIRVYRFVEPADPAGTTSPDAFDTLEATYPDGPHNAETLLLDPLSGDLFVVTKDEGEPPAVFHWRDPTARETAELERVGALDVAAHSLDALVTGGDVTADGTGVVLRTYTNVLWWTRDPDKELDTAFNSDPCGLPSRLESQGEAIALTPRGDAYVTTSEGASEPILRYPRR